jgi:hypothetical protein
MLTDATAHVSCNQAADGKKRISSNNAYPFTYQSAISPYLFVFAPREESNDFDETPCSLVEV